MQYMTADSKLAVSAASKGELTVCGAKMQYQFEYYQEGVDRDYYQ